MTQGSHMRRSLPIAALALLPTLALAQPATLTPRGAVPAASGLVLVPGDSVTVMHNGVATTTLLPSLGAFLGAAPPLASNAVPGLMRGDGSTLTVDPLTGTASVVGAAATPLSGAVLNTDTFLMVRGSGTSAVPYSVTVPQLQAVLGTSSTATSTTATAYTLALTSNSVAVGVADPVTFTPTGGAWPAGEVLTPTASGLTGTFSPATLSPSGSGAVQTLFIASAAGSGTIAATSSPAMTNPSGVALTETVPTIATTYALSLQRSTDTVGNSIIVAATTPGGNFPSGEVLTPSVSGVTGTFSPTTLAVNGSGAATTFTPSSAGTASISVTSSPAMTDPPAVPLTVTAPTTISFAGAAGTQPTGTAALTSVGSNPPTGLALDGNGNLVLPSQTYAYMLFEGAGTHGDGTFEIDAAASGPQPLDIAVFLHASADNSTNTALLFQGENGHVIAYLLGGASGGTTLSAPATFSKIRVTASGGSLTIVVDGTTLGTVTGGTSPVSGYFGVGSSSKASPQVAISGVSFQ